jgi:pimeloyl-ACP methyl ester carboxylesterase
VEHDVALYEIRYRSQNPDGSERIATGLYFLPLRVKAAPMLVYHHGTRLEQKREYKIEGEKGICMGFATEGYQVLYPDYFGLGRGEGFHPYMHAESEAQASLDMLRAIQELNIELGRSASDQLFLTGYSQGGHATMAAHKFLQEHETAFEVTASAPMSGAYDLTGVQSQAVFQPYPKPGYLPYLVYGLNAVYDFLPEETQYFRAPYDTLVPPLMDGEHELDELHAVMPAVPAAAFKPSVRDSYHANPDFPLRKYLRKNNVYDWAPQAPMMMCYCKGDRQVFYRNALKAARVMRANGAERVLLTHAGRRYGHDKCALFASLHVKLWFDSFVAGDKEGRRGALFKRLLIELAKLKIRPARKDPKDF